MYLLLVLTLSIISYDSALNRTWGGGGGSGESHKEEGPGYDQNKEGAKRYLVLFYKLGLFPLYRDVFII